MADNAESNLDEVALLSLRTFHAHLGTPFPGGEREAAELAAMRQVVKDLHAAFEFASAPAAEPVPERSEEPYIPAFLRG